MTASDRKSGWHDAKPFVVYGAVALAFTAAGVGLDWLLDVLHLVSPDNVLAGFGCGFGGCLTGMIAGGVIAVRIIDRSQGS